MKDEIYDFEQRIARCRRTISGLKNGEVALRLLDHLASIGLSAAGISKHAAHLVAVLRLIDFDVANATRSDVERVVNKINCNPRWKEQTKYNKRTVLRRLIQYAKYGCCERGAPVPPEVSWIKLVKKNRDSRVTPEALLMPQDFEAIVKATDNARDGALIYVLFEGALRPGELLSMSVGSVEFKNNYCLITVNGKTGLKRIPLVVSYRPLLDWIGEHPKRDKLQAPLWCSLATNYRGQRLSYRHFRLIIKRLAKKAGLKKSVWPYLFRHTALTNLAKVFTESRLELYAGWVQGSKMARRYVHFSARDLEDAVLELHGMKTPDEAKNVLELMVCPRCEEKNPFGTVRCGKCGFILDRELAAKMEEDERRKDEKIGELAERIKRLEAALASLLYSQQAVPQQSSSSQQPPATTPPAPSSKQQHSQTRQPPQNTHESELKRVKEANHSRIR